MVLTIAPAMHRVGFEVVEKRSFDVEQLLVAGGVQDATNFTSSRGNEV